MDYSVKARRVDGHGSVAFTKAAEIILDTDEAGRADAFNPAELFLASIAACMIKGIDRVTPVLKFDSRGLEIRLSARRQDNPPRLVSVRYEIIIDTDEDDRRLDLLHSNVLKYGTISATVADATDFTGTLRRKLPDSSQDSADHEAEIERIAEINRKQLDAIPAPGADVLHEGP